MAAAATERCHVSPKTAAQGLKCVQALCRGAGSIHHPTIFAVVFHKLIHANVARPKHHENDSSSSQFNSKVILQLLYESSIVIVKLWTYVEVLWAT
jgi:hypothetical protein